mmetsp:Transcript_44991/g.103827  ORF Transcript_44991/g.103827 Transcript_44991/m.103827 type:complete len:304 (+) Transcript_44991:33-944(+)
MVNIQIKIPLGPLPKVSCENLGPGPIGTQAARTTAGGNLSNVVQPAPSWLRLIYHWSSQRRALLLRCSGSAVRLCPPAASGASSLSHSESGAMHASSRFSSRLWSSGVPAALASCCMLSALSSCLRTLSCRSARARWAAVRSYLSFLICASITSNSSTISLTSAGVVAKTRVLGAGVPRTGVRRTGVRAGAMAEDCGCALCTDSRRSPSLSPPLAAARVDRVSCGAAHAEGDPRSGAGGAGPPSPACCEPGKPCTRSEALPPACAPSASCPSRPRAGRGSASGGGPGGGAGRRGEGVRLRLGL